MYSADQFDSTGFFERRVCHIFNSLLGNKQGHCHALYHSLKKEAILSTMVKISIYADQINADFPKYMQIFLKERYMVAHQAVFVTFI